MSEHGRSAIEAALAVAARAPSAHNTQPWRVTVEGDRVIVRADPARWLRHGDPSRRDLWLSVGGFIEGLRLALAANGVRAECADPLAFKGDGATLVLRPGDPAGAAALAAVSLLRRRQTSRLRYSPRAPDGTALAALSAAADSVGLSLHLVEKTGAARRDLEGWFHAAARESWLDVRSVGELAGWLRLDPEGARGADDGLSTHCMGLSPAETVAMAALTRVGLWRAAHATFLAPLLAGALAKAETRTIEEAPFLGVLVAPGDAGDAGAGLLHVWLAATRAGLSLAPASALLDRRGWELGSHLGVSPTRLVAAFRLGRSAPAPRSRRRAVARFASFA
jgi:nitroreductase